jgi:hypothetical protein
MTRAAIITVLFTANLALAQDVTGNWVANPSDSGPLRHLQRLVLKLSRDHRGVLAGTMYAGQFGDLLFGCTSIRVTDGRLNLIMESQGSSGARNQASFGRVLMFAGEIRSDGKSIAGWVQGVGFNERLTFERTGRAPSPKSSPETSSRPVTPAGVPPVATAESSAVLSRALAKLSGTRRLLLKYTCLETIDRSYYAAPVAKIGRDVMTESPPASCNGREFGNNGRLTLTAEDRLRLEVAVADGKEIDSWASASKFDSRSIHEVVSTGPTNTGAFGTALVDIFENPVAHYTFLGKQSVDGREVFEYSFEVPLDASNYRVGSENGWKTTAYHGSFVIDAATGELTRLVSETADLPSDARACRYRTSTDYHYQSIGDGQYLIPLKSDFDVLLPSGSEDHSAIVFSGCREYGAESSLILGGEAPSGPKEAAAKPARALPPGLSLMLALATPIDTNTAAAGDAISAKVTKSVRAPKSGEILVAAGAIARGRILQLRHEAASGKFLIAIRYDTLEQDDAVEPLSMRLERELKAAQAPSGNGFATRGTEFSLPPATSESGSWFALSPVEGRATMAAGSETKWITVSQ